MNTKIHYLYRDASNYKMPNEAVVKGEITQHQINTIINCLSDYDPDEGCGYFIPSQVGLPEKRFDEFTEDDHCWFELCDDAFEPTESANCVISAEQLVSNFIKADKAGWDTMFNHIIVPIPEERSDESILAEADNGELFERDGIGGGTEIGLRVRTEIGDLIAYPSSDPDHPGICLMYQPEGEDIEIDVAYSEIPVDHEEDFDNKVHTYIYEDCTKEDYTGTFTLDHDEVIKALNKN